LAPNKPWRDEVLKNIRSSCKGNQSLMARGSGAEIEDSMEKFHCYVCGAIAS